MREAINLIDFLPSPRCCRQSNFLVPRIIDGIKSLKECQAIDEIKPFPTGRLQVANDEVYLIGSSSNVRVESAWPDLGIGSEFKGHLEIA